MATADLLSSLGLTDAAMTESWESKNHGSADTIGDAVDILGKLGLSDIAQEAWEGKK